MPRMLASLYLKLFGWKVYDSPPDLKKCIVLAAPHTSNWDGVNMLAMASVYRIRVHWVGKHTLFKWPMGGWLRRVGGVPVNRSSRQKSVQQLTAEFANRQEFRLVIAPEGTRKSAKFWKSGFYIIACEAKVPIVLGLLDYKKKLGGLFEVVYPTGDIRADMEKIRRFYLDAQGKHPGDFGPIRLREEADSPVA